MKTGYFYHRCNNSNFRAVAASPLHQPRLLTCPKYPRAVFQPCPKLPTPTRLRRHSFLRADCQRRWWGRSDLIALRACKELITHSREHSRLLRASGLAAAHKGKRRFGRGSRESGAFVTRGRTAENCDCACENLPIHCTHGKALRTSPEQRLRLVEPLPPLYSR